MDSFYGENAMNENGVRPSYPISSSVGTDESITASAGSSISSVRNVISGMNAKDWIFVSMAILFAVVLGVDIAERNETQAMLRENTVATDLAKYNSQEVRIQTEVNKQLMTALACKR